MDKKKLIVIAVALIAVVVIVIGAAAALLSQNDSYASKVELGYRYLKQGDYDNAILIFLEAISMDEGGEDAYYGLYQAYVHSGQDNMAMTTLRVGAGNSRSPLLEELLEEKRAEQEAAGNNGTQSDIVGDVPGSDTSKDDGSNDMVYTPVLNTELLTMLSSATYDDYCSRYGNDVGNTTTGRYSRYITTLGATLVYADSADNQVLDPANGMPYGDRVPTDIQLDNVTVLFGGIAAINYETIRNMSGIADATNNGGTISFTYRDCWISIACDADGYISASSENHIVPTQKTSTPAQTEYTMIFTVVDATTGGTVSGARVDAYEGYSTSGTPVTGYSDATGQVSLRVYASGTYTIRVSFDGFITETFEVLVMTNVTVIEQDISISPVMAADSIRFVLTWGASPTDLDSHLDGTSGDGASVNVYYGNQREYDNNGELVSELDVDDRDGYGPETTTLYDTSGIYEFYIIDYTGSGTMSSSGAEVKIYVGDSLYTTVTVPADLGNYWSICTIADGNITVTNHG